MKKKTIKGDWMKIAIIGGGAIGLLFATYLSNNHVVAILCRRQEQVERILQKGVTIERDHHNIHAQVHATTDWRELSAFDWIIVTVKQYDIQSVLAELEKNIFTKANLLFVQNGMGHIEYISKLIHEHIFVATVEHGVSKINDNMAKLNGLTRTNIAAYRGESRRYEQLQTREFPFLLHSNYELMLQRKLVINAVINPLTALFRVTNGQLITNPYFKKIMNELYDEIILCLPKIKEVVTISDVEHICQATHTNQSSMLKDIIHQRPTEVEAILGYIRNKAREKQLNLPLTHFLYDSIKGLEQSTGAS